LRPADVAPVVLGSYCPGDTTFDSVTLIFCMVLIFWQSVGICHHFGHIFTKHAQKLLFPLTSHAIKFSDLDFLKGANNLTII